MIAVGTDLCNFPRSTSWCFSWRCRPTSPCVPRRTTRVDPEPANTVALYFGAHPDDSWQLFMNPNAWVTTRKKPSNSSRVLMVTAGGTPGSASENKWT